MPTNPSPTTLVNTGPVLVGSDQTVDVQAGQVVNDGQVFIRGGTVAFAGQLTGTGMLAVAQGGTAEFHQIVGSGQFVSLFRGALILDNPHDFLGTIMNWSTAGTMLLPHTTLTGADFAGGVLTLHDGTFTEGQFRVAGAFSTSDFHVTNGGDGTAAVTVVVRS